MAFLFILLVSMNGAFIIGLLGEELPFSSTTQSNTPNKGSSDAALLHQILIQETTLRIELEKNVRNMMTEIEQLKKNQAAMEVKVDGLTQAKIEQYDLIQQLSNNVTTLSMENIHLKTVLFNSSNGFYNTGSNKCMCDFTNISKDIQSVKKEVRYVSLSFLDLARDVQLMNTSILETMRNGTGEMTRDVFNILSDIQNLSRIQDQDRQYQMSVNTDLKIHQEDVSNRIKDHIDKEVLNLTAKYFELENQDHYLTSTLRNSELFLSKVAVFMNEMRNKVAFSATIKSSVTSLNGQTLIFPHVLCNVGGGYNSHDGVFTAPVDGVYVFFVRITQSTNSHDLRVNIVLNGIEMAQHFAFGRIDHSYRTSANSVVLNLNQSDRVWVKMNIGGEMYSIGADQSFAGYKL